MDRTGLEIFRKNVKKLINHETAFAMLGFLMILTAVVFGLFHDYLFVILSSSILLVILRAHIRVTYRYWSSRVKQYLLLFFALQTWRFRNKTYPIKINILNRIAQGNKKINVF